jgi:sugar lactone lactonase YvrE
MAFDGAGNLWVANTGNNTVAAFTPPQLAGRGPVAPHVVLSSSRSSLDLPVGLAFDGAGSLWVVGGTGALTKFAPASLRASGAPAPSARLQIGGHTLFWSVAFWPKPAGLPLN